MSPAPLRLVLSSAEITKGRHQLATWARSLRLPQELIERLELAVYEALANAAEHAYDGGSGQIELAATLDGSRLSVAVADRGRWKAASMEPSMRGMGLPLIRQLTDHSSVAPSATGTTVRLHWDLG